VRLRWCGLGLLPLVIVPSAHATVALTGVTMRVGDHPGFVRVVVTFTDGDLRAFDASTLDPSIMDGGALLEVAHVGVRAEAPAVAALGVRAALVQGRDRVLLRLRATPGRFKYVSYRALAGPERLVVDLWKAAAPVPGIRNDGCLRMVTATVAPRRVTIAGRELRQIFEHNVVLRLRDAAGKQIAIKPVTSVNRRWAGSLSYRAAAAGPATLEASSHSARDGSLECLVQVPVVLGSG
jgi:hypothetical protein